MLHNLASLASLVSWKNTSFDDYEFLLQPLHQEERVFSQFYRSCLAFCPFSHEENFQCLSVLAYDVALKKLSWSGGDGFFVFLQFKMKQNKVLPAFSLKFFHRQLSSCSSYFKSTFKFFSFNWLKLYNVVFKIGMEPIWVRFRSPQGCRSSLATVAHLPKIFFQNTVNLPKIEKILVQDFQDF